MLHRLRAAMGQTGRDRLGGDVEVDETYVGGREEGGGRGRSRSKKQVVVIACERISDTQMGRIRMARAPSASAVALRQFIEENIEPGSVVMTDAWVSYPTAIAALAADGLHYTHKVTNLSGQFDHAHVVFPHVHRVAALLKRWLLGTHQGPVEAHHLDKFVFRFNRRNSRNRGLLFWRLLCALSDHPPLTRAELAQRREQLKRADAEHHREVVEQKREAKRKADQERRRRNTEHPAQATPAPEDTDLEPF